MGHKTRSFLFLVPLILILGTALPPLSSAQTSTVIPVLVSIPPQAYFVKRIGGPYVEVRTLLDPGQSDETYEPTPRQLTAMGDSWIYFQIGLLPFERSLGQKLQGLYPRLKMINTSQGVPLQRSKSYSETSPDPHIWMDPQLVKEQVRVIYNTLVNVAPDHQDEFKSNLKTFEEELDKTDQEVRNILRVLPDRYFLTLHPSLGYFASAYGLEQISIESEGKEPDSQALIRLIELAKAKRIHTVFVQPQSASKIAETLAQALQAKIAPLDPMAYDYLNNLVKIAETFRGDLSD